MTAQRQHARTVRLGGSLCSVVFGSAKRAHGPFTNFYCLLLSCNNSLHLFCREVFFTNLLEKAVRFRQHLHRQGTGSFCSYLAMEPAASACLVCMHMHGLEKVNRNGSEEWRNAPANPNSASSALQAQGNGEGQKQVGLGWE